MTKGIKAAACTAAIGVTALLTVGIVQAGAADTPNPEATNSAAQSTNSSASTASGGNGQYQAVKQQPDGMWVDKAGNPTFKIGPNGKVGWYTYEGFIQYSANCLQCHGPDGLGSSYAPNLVDALKNLSYAQFLGIVAGGMKSVSASQDLVMPSFGTNKNVMCYINPIYVYLRARSTGALGRGRPPEHEPVTKDFNKEVDSCMG